MSDPTRRLYVKLSADAARELTERPVQVSGAPFRWEPVFSRDSSAETAPGGGDTWMMLEALGDAPDVHPWDLAHALRDSSLAAAFEAGEVRTAEAPGTPNPDDFPVQLSSSPGGGSTCTPAGPDTFWPDGGSLGWHLQDAWTQLKRARESVDFSGRRVRIGHIDTGYDPGHVAVPRHLRADLGWNFDKGNGDTVDRYSASFPFSFGGPGPSTMSVLAGGRVSEGGFTGDLGGAPEAEVVPIVASPSVIIAYSGNWARAIDWAVAKGCDVISISAGGYIYSQMLFDAVTAAVQRGVVVCAAAGNHYGCIRTATTFPAAFPHVLSVTGALSNQEPYETCWLHRYSACTIKLGSLTQIAAYGANIAKAPRGCRTTVDRNGDGTSHATPQAAAAVALYFQKRRDMPRDGRRVLAARNAFFSTASKVHLDYFYQGILRANDALRVAPSYGVAAEAEAETGLAFPLFDALPGVERMAPATRAMLRAEAITLASRSAVGAERLARDPHTAAADSGRALVEVLAEAPGASLTLRRALDAATPALSTRIAVPGAIVGDPDAAG